MTKEEKARTLLYIMAQRRSDMLERLSSPAFRGMETALLSMLPDDDSLATLVATVGVAIDLSCALNMLIIAAQVGEDHPLAKGGTEMIKVLAPDGMDLIKEGLEKLGIETTRK